MILWILLFVLVVAISFILAAKSMRDFADIPSIADEYSLFLIRKLDFLNKDLLDQLISNLLKQNKILSFERLFKGDQSALVVFGPRHLLLNHKAALDLLELEDYTDINVNHISAWEVGIKKMSGEEKIFSNLPKLLENEQFWWQVIVSVSLKPQITAMIVSADTVRRNTLREPLQHLEKEKVVKLPKAFSNSQLLDFYKARSLRGDNNNPVLNTEDFLDLLRI